MSGEGSGNGNGERDGHEAPIVITPQMEKAIEAGVKIMQGEAVGNYPELLKDLTPDQLDVVNIKVGERLKKSKN